MEIDARGSEKSLSFCYLKIDNIFCVSRLTREGSGSTVLALLEELKNQGINYQTRVHLTCTDLDSNVLMMCYIQLSLLGAKATCIVEDSLANKQFDRFYTFRNFC